MKIADSAATRLAARVCQICESHALRSDRLPLEMRQSLLGHEKDMIVSSSIWHSMDEERFDSLELQFSSVEIVVETHQYPADSLEQSKRIVTFYGPEEAIELSQTSIRWDRLRCAIDYVVSDADISPKAKTAILVVTGLMLVEMKIWDMEKFYSEVEK